MIKIALIKADFIHMLSPCVIPPIGLLQISSVLNANGIGSKVFDLQIIRYNKIKNELLNIIDYKPDYIGISAVSTQYELVIWISQFFKKIIPEIPILVGGPLASVSADKLLKCKSIDYIFKGEAEETIISFINLHQKKNDLAKIPGIAFNDNNKIVNNPSKILSKSLDDLPMIQWEKVNFNYYSKFLSMTFHRTPFAPILTSRGCPYTCIFCHKMFGNRFRTRSIKHIFNELNHLYHDLKIRRIEIIDDIFNFDYDRATNILKKIRDELPLMSVNFGNGLRIDKLDEPFIKLLKEVKCNWFGLPIETANERIQKIIRKKISLKKIDEIVKLTRKYKIHTWGYFIIGLPTETQEEMEHTLNYADKIDVDFVEIQSANPYEGSDMHDMLIDRKNNKLANFFGNYIGDEIDMNFLNQKKLHIMRSRYKKRENFYFFFNLIAWKLWWLGPKKSILHILSFIFDLFLKNKSKTVKTLENEGNDIANSIKKSLCE